MGKDACVFEQAIDVCTLVKVKTIEIRLSCICGCAVCPKLFRNLGCLEPYIEMTFKCMPTGLSLK